MRITVVGSSHGVPEPRRRCACIMIEIAGRTYFVDMGASAIEAMIDRQMKIESVKAIFFTHKHGDHIDGLIPMVDLMSWYFKKAAPEIYLPDIRFENALKVWLAATGCEVREGIRFFEEKEGTFYDDDVLSVTAFKSAHCEGAKSFVISAEGKNIIITGDLKHNDGPDVEYPILVKECAGRSEKAGRGKTIDLVICEAAHFGSEKYLPHFEENPPKIVCYTHYSNPKVGGIIAVRDALKGKSEVFLGTDGTVIEL